jgi:hypothetical protein
VNLIYFVARAIPVVEAYFLDECHRSRSFSSVRSTARGVEDALVG